MPDMRYEAPRSIEDAVGLLASRDPEDIRVLAGGTDLLVQMSAGVRRPSTVVNVKHIPELVELRFESDGTLWLGAATPAAAIGEDPRVRQRLPGLAEAVALIGSDQIQGRASVGGNLCNGSPAADTVPSLWVLDARCHVAGPAGVRRALPVAEFVLSPGRTALAPGELLDQIEIPPLPARAADAYLRLIPRSEMDIAVVGAAVRLELDASGLCTDARVALSAVAPTVIDVPAAAEALRGTAVDADALGRAEEAARAACRPIDDKRGTAEYRRRVAGVLCSRAARAALERATQR